MSIQNLGPFVSATLHCLLLSSYGNFKKKSLIIACEKAICRINEKYGNWVKGRINDSTAIRLFYTLIVAKSPSTFATFPTFKIKLHSQT